MDISKMKNMVVLKNLPSNIVDEAFIVLKSNKKIKNLEKVEKNRKNNIQNDGKKDKEYVLKEAEMLVSDYILNMENIEKNKNNIINPKSKKIKMWALSSTFVAVVEGIILLST